MNKGLIAVCVTTLLCVVLGVYGLLTAYKVDTAQFLSLFSTTAAPLILLFYNILKTNQAVQQTNGPLTEVGNKVEYLWEKERARNRAEEPPCGGSSG